VSPLPDPDADVRAGRNRWVTLLGFGIGAALLIAAIASVAANWGPLRDRWQSDGAPAWGPGRLALAVALVLLPGANWFFTSASFWVLTRPYGRVGLGEMGALIASASLLNYFPLRPGLIGRVAYHRTVNGIPVWASAKILSAAIACSGVAASVLLVTTGAAGPAASRPVEFAALVAPGVVLAGLWAVAWSTEQAWASYPGGVFLRYLAMMAWTGRYAAAFAVWGAPIGIGAAAVLAAVSQAVSLVPLAGNGLGLREWGTGYTTAWLVSAGIVATGDTAARDLGLAADLVNRMAELVLLIPIGVLGWVWVVRRLAGHDPGNGPDGAPTLTLTEPSLGGAGPVAADGHPSDG
jgi:hypothetical protein